MRPVEAAKAQTGTAKGKKREDLSNEQLEAWN
jgi:hypothetical protein